MAIAPWLQAFDPIRAASAGGQLGLGAERNALEARGQDVQALDAAGKLGLSYASLAANERQAEREERMKMAQYAAERLIHLSQMATTQANVQSEIAHRQALEEHAAATTAATAAAALETKRHHLETEEQARTKASTSKPDPFVLKQYDQLLREAGDERKLLNAESKKDTSAMKQPDLDAHAAAQLSHINRIKSLQAQAEKLRLGATAAGPTSPVPPAQQTPPPTLPAYIPQLIAQVPPSPASNWSMKIVSVRRKKEKPVPEKEHPSNED